MLPHSISVTISSLLQLFQWFLFYNFSVIQVFRLGIEVPLDYLWMEKMTHLKYGVQKFYF